jgi:hypothetical protein
MSSLYLPPRVAAEENKRFFADLRRNVTANDPVAQEWTQVVKQIHPDLWVVRAHDTVDADLPLRPGFYHVLKINQIDVAPVSVEAIHDDGRWCEPNGRVIENLLMGDLSQRRNRDRIAEHDRIVQEAVERENRARNETRREELLDRVKAATEARISMSRDTPWTQNVAGRKGAKR